MSEPSLNELIEQGYISKRKHPEADLFIYNYTAKAQYDWVWNEHTMECRGLIKDAADKVIARPFRKFFNYKDDTIIPNEPFEVYEKLDGSLGILYWLDDKPFIATRGSFESEQADRATEMLSGYSTLKLDRSKTYLFEIIYPENRIVVDYCGAEKLVHLATLDTVTGQDLPLNGDWPHVVKRYDGINDLAELKALQNDKEEGFVIKFQSGLRLKLKFEEYVRLHRILTQVSNVIIWEHLSQGKPLDEVLERVPDEFNDWVRQTERELKVGYDSIEDECRAAFRDLGDRKETALYFQTQNNRHVLFAMLDGKDYSQMIWKGLRPKYCKPFTNDNDA